MSAMGKAASVSIAAAVIAAAGGWVATVTEWGPDSFSEWTHEAHQAWDNLTDAGDNGSGDGDTLANDLTLTDPEEARETLQGMPVSPGTMSGYSREDYPHWNTASNYGWGEAPAGCDTRDTALMRDGQDVTVGDDCAIHGSWTDPFGGQSTSDPGDLDADHLVPLANAHRSGADQWGPQKREDYANDPLVVVMADSGLNRTKGDQGPEAWKPPSKDAWCLYGLRWIQIKNDWDLSLQSPAEREALTEMIATCQEK